MLAQQTIAEQPDKSCHKVCSESGKSAQIWEVFSEEVPFELLPEQYLRAVQAGKTGQVDKGIAKVKFFFAKDQV